MLRQKTIVVLIPYFGQMPWYFTYFIHSCRYNSSVDFFIITDNKIEATLPDNIKVIYRTLEEISHTIRKKLNITIQLKNPYKLCDFRPAFGLIFSDLTVGYDVWGYGDIDVIFGNIRTFMTDEVLERHDIISVRHDYLTGYFQLIKNDERMKYLFTNSKDYLKVFCSDRNFCFDETNYWHEAFTEGISYIDIKSEIESMTHVVHKMTEAGQLKPYFDFHIVEGRLGEIKWNNGHLFYKNKFEIILYHLIDFKKVFRPSRPVKSIPNEFRISPTRIYLT